MQRRRLLISAGLPLLVLIGVVTMAYAVKAPTQKAERVWMRQVTKSAPGEFKKVRPCELFFELSWNGILKAGEATLKLGMPVPKIPQHLMGTCEGRSAGIAKTLWYYRNHFRSAVDSNSLKPILFESHETEKKEKIITRANFANGVVTSTETVENRKTGKSKTKERVFAYEHAHDLLSSVLYLRSHPLNDGDEINMVVHPFKSAYFAKFKVLGRDNFKSGIGRQRAIKLDIKLYKIDRDDLDLKSYSKFKKATLWISEDAYRMPLEIRSEVFIGSVRASLKERRFLK